jgi:hypothetical protein
MAKSLPEKYDDLTRPYKSKRSFDYSEKEMTESINRLMDAQENSLEFDPRKEFKFQ